MRKQIRKLTLHRETLLRLERSELGRVRGGQVARLSGEDTCGACDTIASCTELQEDCCVTTAI
ncbi:MAG TPA: hypothetical protein VGP73_27935 [Thermoanaerobaculia bacterium]